MYAPNVACLKYFIMIGRTKQPSDARKIRFAREKTHEIPGGFSQKPLARQRDMIE
jgi:hypothetical protein